MALFKRDVKKRLREMNAGSFITLRNTLDSHRGGFAKAPVVNVMHNSEIDYNRARKIYYNQDPTISNGAFFAKSIVDGIADHVGMPLVSMQDENADSLVHGWINNRWKKPLWEMYRNSLRDTKCWVRLRKPFASPLIADNERNDVVMEILDADNVEGYYDPFTNELTRVEIAMDVYIEDQPFDPLNIPAQGARAYGRVHRIVEIITPQQYLYYDQTEGELIDSATLDNAWGFVPLIEVFNDYDSALHGGSSVLENVYPFFQAFHDVCVQTRASHAYHADPKVKFKLDDVMNFLRNNFAEAFDSDGQFTGQISWKGKDVYFMESEEDVGFIEAHLNTGDSVELMEFLVDCMCIAGEVTEAILFRAKSAQVGETDELFRFKARVERARNGFAEYIQLMVKMALKISTGNIARLPAISWAAMQTEDLVSEGQAMNQIITASEVANRANIISRSTYRARIRQFYPNMKDDAAEDAQALTESDEEQKRQLAYEVQAAALKGHDPTAAINGAASNGQIAGQNGAVRSRTKLPLDVIPTSPGN